MNSEPVSMSVKEAKTRLVMMKDSLTNIDKPGTVADREYRTYLEMEISTYEKSIMEFEAKEKG